MSEDKVPLPPGQTPLLNERGAVEPMRWWRWFLAVNRFYQSAKDFGLSLLGTLDAAAAKLLLGLDLVDNTSDADKPISDETQAALDAITAGLPGSYQPLDSDLTAIAALTTTTFGRAFLALVDGPAALTYIGAQAAGSYQPLDSDLTAIAALSTTSFGRSFLTLADAAAGLTLLGTISSSAIAAAYQPLDADLTAIAALTTTSYGRGFLDRADAAAALTYLGTISSSAIAAAYQPLDSDLTAIAALTTTSYGRAFLALADAAAARTAIGAVIGTDVQAYDADLAALAANATNGLWARTAAGTGAARTITGSSTVTVTNGDGVSGNPTLSVPDDAITYAKIQNVTTAKLLGRKTAGSGDVEELYLESGSWTPTVNLATPGTSSVAYTAQTGAYYRIGDRVFCDFTMVAAITIGTGSGNLEIGGLPFNVASTNAGGALRNSAQNLTWPAGTTQLGMLALSSTKFGLRAFGSNVVSVIITAAHITSGGNLSIAGQFQYQA